MTSSSNPSAPPGRDIIVIGASAGGLKALTAIVANLPADLEASLFVVQHMAPDMPSLLPHILADVGPLPAAHANEGEAIRKGRIYVAPPDHHLLVNQGYVRVLRGPRENRFRPSIDTLFRSAARACGPRVVGVVLTGYLDDGTVGLQAVKARGGVAVVQDPEEAEYPSMPSSAQRYVNVDHSLRLLDIPPLLVRLAGEAVAQGKLPAPEKDVAVESDISQQQMNTEQLLQSVETLGTPTTYTCPTCNGTLWQMADAEPPRFRCHVGHAFSADALLADQTRNLENALWSAVRLMEEKVTLSRRLAERRRALNLPAAAEPYEQYAQDLDQEVSTLRRLIMGGFATQYLNPAAAEEEP